MGRLKITFSLPEELAIQFVRAVPSKRRSKFVAGLIEAKLAERKAEREAMLIAACEALNADPKVSQLERDMEGLMGDGLDEHEWEESPTR